MNEKATILYVEDDETLSFVTKDNLELNGYKVIHARNGKEAIDLFENNGIDICIFDVMMPEMDGFTLASEIRKRDQDIPIIFLTAKSLKEDRIHGLRIGADDYITKPFSIEELLLRINVFLRRSKVVEHSQQTPVQIGSYAFDYANLSLKGPSGERILTQKEADLLWMLYKNRNQVSKRPDILKSIWGADDYFMGRSMDVFISRLRKYLEEDPSIRIENIHSVGFKFIVK